MAWTNPATWLSKELVVAGKVNIQLRDNMIHLKIPIDDAGKIIAIDSTRFASLDGSAITAVAKLAQTNLFTAGKHDFNAGSATRLMVPVGVDKWAQ